MSRTVKTWDKDAELDRGVEARKNENEKLGRGVELGSWLEELSQAVEWKG